MRVTDTVIWDMSRRHVVRAQARLFAATERVASGDEMDHPDNAPASTSEIRSIEACVARLDEGEAPSRRASMQLRGAELALGEVGSLLVRAREIAAGGSHGWRSADRRPAMASDIGSLRVRVRALANTRVGDSYIFGGFRTGTPPFLANGSFIGDEGAYEIEVLPGLWVAANVSGARAFTAVGGVDVFATLEQLDADLRDEDPGAIASHLPDLDTAIRQVLSERTEAETLLVRIESADAIRDYSIQRLDEARSGSHDADVPAAIAELVQARCSLRLALETAARLLQITAEPVREPPRGARSGFFEPARSDGRAPILGGDALPHDGDRHGV